VNRTRRPDRVEHRFVKFVPEELEPATLYISMEYATVVHRCLCGCGERVVTPLTPTDWRLGYDGESVSLSRSVGNWSFPCQSHYIVDRSRVIWARGWPKEKIDTNRARDFAIKARYCAGESIVDGPDDQLGPGWEADAINEQHPQAVRRSGLRALLGRLLRKPSDGD
jgi:hypothetical protein